MGTQHFGTFITQEAHTCRYHLAGDWKLLPSTVHLRGTEACWIWRWWLMPRRRWACKASSKTSCCLSAILLFWGIWILWSHWILLNKPKAYWHIDKDFPLVLCSSANQEAFELACATLGCLWWSWKSSGWRSEAEFFPSIFLFEGRRL